VMCVNVCVYFVCVIDVAEGHRSALLSLAWQVCVLCVYVFVFVRVWMCLNVCAYFVCVIDVAEGHMSPLLSLAWQVCVLCVCVLRVCVCVCVCVCACGCVCMRLHMCVHVPGELRFWVDHINVWTCIHKIILTRGTGPMCE